MSDVTTRPILFSGEMVRAILDGHKTQTRRPVKPRDPTWTYSTIDDGWPWTVDDAGDWHRDKCPFGKPGDALWVRECWRVSAAYDSYPPRVLTKHTGTVEYRAGGGMLNGERIDYVDSEQYGEEGKWRPSIHMPRWACRLILDVTDIRVERVQAITPSDCEEEGITGSTHATPVRGHPYDIYRACVLEFSTPRLAFENLWDEIYGGGSWDENPWVWVVTFKMHEGPTT